MKTLIKKSRTKSARRKPAKSLKPIGSRSKFPIDLQPMLATLIDKPFDEPGWTYEIKWDGYRALAYIRKNYHELRSRNNKSFNEKFYPVYDALKDLRHEMVLDGEIIVANKEGISNFGNLQNWRSEADGELKFYVFDLLWLDGYSLMDLPLTERRAKLVEIVPEHPIIQISQEFQSTGSEFFDVASKMGLEGIMAKKADSNYKAGFRTKEWLKIKVANRHEVVIGGYTQNEGSAKRFSSLLVGVYDKGKLRYIGKIGTGFNDKMQKEMMDMFKPLVTDKIPFDIEPDVNKPSRFRPDPPRAKATWLKPKLVCEVSYTEMTTDGIMRHPSFEGMRIDKTAKQVTEEKAKSVKSIVSGKSILHKKKLIKTTDDSGRKTFLNPADETQERKVNGHNLRFTNLSKLYWPKDKITKRDMLNYYYKVASYMLPYLKDRPQSLNRFPNGIDGKSFYQKNVADKVPDWIQTFPYQSADENEQKEFLVCSNEASLLYMASLGCIEMNPWSSRIQKPDQPDWCIIDLDPDKNTFDKVIEAALVTKQVLDSADIPSFPKTSGSTGIHIYIPLGAKYSYEQSKEFARLIVQLVHAEIPGFTSIERATKLRKGKLYLDFLQNRPQATLAAAYSLRPKPGATVSAPLYWDELKKGLKLKDFTIHNMPDRIKEIGDIFKPVLGKGINLKKVLDKMIGDKR